MCMGQEQLRESIRSNPEILCQELGRSNLPVQALYTMFVPPGAASAGGMLVSTARIEESTT